MVNIEPKTELAKAIEKKIIENPTLEDGDIAELIFYTNHPGEKYEGKEPSQSYVSKQRTRLMFRQREGPNINVEKVESTLNLEEEESKEESGELDLIPGIENIETPGIEEKPQEPKKPIPDYPFGEDELKGIIDLATGILADRTGFDGFKLKEEESTKLSVALSKVIIKYEDRFLAFIEKYGAEVTLLITASIIFTPKILAYNKFTKTKGEKK